jgi:hypothetical protein
MSIACDVILKWEATPEQLTALGAALWRWCNRTAGGPSIYQSVDNQALADLIAGQFPAADQTRRQAGRRSVPFRVPGEAGQGRRATIDSLRRSVPAEGVEDILVDGKSWSAPG